MADSTAAAIIGASIGGAISILSVLATQYFEARNKAKDRKLEYLKTKQAELNNALQVDLPKFKEVLHLDKIKDLEASSFLESFFALPQVATVPMLDRFMKLFSDETHPVSSSDLKSFYDSMYMGVAAQMAQNDARIRKLTGF